MSSSPTASVGKIVNITVLDQSPTFLYSPDREGVSSNSWQSAWTGSADSSYDLTHTQPNIAQGTSSHVTSRAGATVEIEFMGVAVSLYGQGTAGAYTTVLDSGSPVSGSPSGSMLATYGGLNDTVKHKIELRVTESQPLSLSYATFTIRSDLVSTSVVNTTQIAVTTGTNNALTTNSFFSTSGSGFSNEHEDQGYTRIDSSSSDALISFSCSNTSALFVYGTTNWNHQTFSVELDPPAGVSEGPRIFNGTSKWFVLDNLIFWEGGMDPSQTYQVKVTNLNGGSYTDIHSPFAPYISVLISYSRVASSNPQSTSASNPQSTSDASSPTASATPASGSGTGKTVGIAVGVVAVFAALILFAFLCRRRRARRRNQTRMTIDGMMVTPFGEPQSNPQNTSPAGSDTPISLSHFRGKSDAYQSSHQNSSYGDSYPNSSYGAYPGNYGAYATTSAANSVHDLSRGSRTHGAHYSELSGSDDFNPYSPRTSTALPYLTGPPSVIASGGSSSRPQSGVTTQADPPMRPQAYARNPEKGPIPSETASMRAVRQEVDAGRVPAEEEETLPPTYDPAWSN
ncbi:hypothetical protein B0H13DRAFT_1962802 [Mycena leptocephala]|nr:hypothetical protein B0H13DRAFT_1962802 [Mycena leptocephala]